MSDRAIVFKRFQKERRMIVGDQILALHLGLDGTLYGLAHLGPVRAIPDADLLDVLPCHPHLIVFEEDRESFNTVIEKQEHFVPFGIWYEGEERELVRYAGVLGFRPLDLLTALSVGRSAGIPYRLEE